MHKHLTWTDRLKIEKGLKEGLKPCAIADRLHVHNTTIYRELKRGRYTHLNSDLTTEERYYPPSSKRRSAKKAIPPPPSSEKSSGWG